MSGLEVPAAIGAAFVGGVLTSASPCVLAAVPIAIGFIGGTSDTPRRSLQLALVLVAGMTLALTALGLAAARLGTLMGALPGAWSVAAGAAVVAGGIWVACDRRRGSVTLAPNLKRRLANTGFLGALVLGVLLGTALTPCASPALAAALAWAGSGGAFSHSMWFGAALLGSYALGHGLLVFLAGASPSAAQALILKTGKVHWLPGNRVFGLLMALAGAWLAVQPYLP